MKILFRNASPNKNGNTSRIGEELLHQVDHDTLYMRDCHICQYGVVDETDEIKDIFKKIENYDTLVIGAPVYWYTVGGILKTFIDRLYMLKEAEALQGKDLYFLAQGSSPDESTIQTITHLASRVATLMEMNLKGVVVDSSDGRKIISTFSIK